MKPKHILQRNANTTNVVEFSKNSENLQPNRCGNGRRRSKRSKTTDLQSNTARDAAVSAFILAQRTWEDECKSLVLPATDVDAGSSSGIHEIDGKPFCFVGWIEINDLYARYRDWVEVEGRANGHAMMTARKFRNGCEANKMESRRVWDPIERRHYTERRIKQPHPAMYGTTFEPVEQGSERLAA